MSMPDLKVATQRVAPVATGPDAPPVEFTIDAANEASEPFTIQSKAQLSAWLTTGSWSGTLGITVAPAGSNTFMPVMVGSTRLLTFTALGFTPLEFYEIGMQVRVEAGADFSGTVTGRIG